MNIQLDPRVSLSAHHSNLPKKPSQAQSDAQLRESTREFEAMFIFQMYKTMRKNIPEDGLIQRSSASNLFQEMLDMEMARNGAAGNGMGIGQVMYEQLKKDMVSP